MKNNELVTKAVENFNRHIIEKAYKASFRELTIVGGFFIMVAYFFYKALTSIY